MDPILPIAELAPALGAAALLGVLLLRFWRQNSADRTAHNEEVSRIHLQHAEYVRGLVAQHGAEVARLREEIDNMTVTKDRLRANVERERELRWAAQEEAAQLRRQYGVASGAPGEPAP